MFSLMPLDDVAALAPRWRDLERRADPPACLAWPWIGAWLRRLPADARPHLLEIRAGASTLGLAVLTPSVARRHGWLKVRQWRLHEAGIPPLDALAIEDNGILLDQSCPPSLLSACFRWLAASLPQLDELVLSSVPMPLAEVAQAGLAGAGLACRLVRDDLRRFVDLDEVRAKGGYLSTLGSATRQAIRRARRLYEGHGPLHLRAAASVEQAWCFLDRMKPLHEARWQHKGEAGAFALPDFVPFHRDLIAAAWGEGGVELLELTAGARLVGYLYNLRRRGWVHNYQGGFAYSADAREKPGLVCHHAAIVRAAAMGERFYDLMAGDSRYKANLARRTDRLVTLAAAAPRPALRAEQALRSLKALLHRPTPAPVA